MVAAISEKLCSVVTGYGQVNTGFVSLLFSLSGLFAAGSEFGTLSSYVVDFVPVANLSPYSFLFARSKLRSINSTLKQIPHQV